MHHRRRFLLRTTAAVAVVAAPTLPAAAPVARDAFAAHALNRLGFGPGPGDLPAVMRDTDAWIAQQLAPPPPVTPAQAERWRVGAFEERAPVETLRRYVELLQQRNLQARDPARAAPAAPMEPDPSARLAGVAAPMAAGHDLEAADGDDALRRYVRGLQLPAYEARLWRAIESPRPLEEAMVDFWFNHFNVFQNKNYVRVLVGHYEAHAIRPFALGRFGDLLAATAHHPAMLYYLDNWQSAGAGTVRNRGLNENYARELMELHTMGVDAGYTQRDVTELARMLTGWTFVPPRAGPRVQADEASGFRFDARVHDNGEKLWLGRRIAAGGRAEGDLALETLARHPATARHVSFKLAQYFVADQPPPALVAQLATVFLREDGQIVPVLRTLFASDAFRAPEAFGAKFKTPYQHTLSVLRAAGVTLDDVRPVATQLGAQGMPLFGCATPDGYKNTEAAWLSPDGMNRRLAFATQVAAGRLAGARFDGGDEPPSADALIDRLGPLVTPATRTLAAQKRHEPRLAAALVLGGPGMMRR